MGLSEEASASWVSEEDDLLKEMITEGHQMSDILHLFEGKNYFFTSMALSFFGIGMLERDKRKKTTRYSKDL